MQFTTKSGLVDVPNEEVLAAADTIRGDQVDVVGQLQRRINELKGINTRVVDERDALRKEDKSTLRAEIADLRTQLHLPLWRKDGLQLTKSELPTAAQELSDLRTQLQAAREDVARLQSNDVCIEIGELQKFKARLDWLANPKNVFKFAITADGHAKVYRKESNYDYEMFPDLNTAISAAMSKGPR